MYDVRREAILETGAAVQVRAGDAEDQKNVQAAAVWIEKGC